MKERYLRADRTWLYDGTDCGATVTTDHVLG
jgi:hypothetical protein